MVHPLDGIREKLKRADESIGNLNGEIKAFFDEGLYAVMPDQEDKAFQEAIDYHSKRTVPVRFSVLAGEIVHHLRSSLDHLVWLLSDDSYRRSHPTMIEFPVLTQPPSKDELARYKRKIQGVSSSRAAALIRVYQPCYGPNPLDSPLAILHDFDRFDKHRELVIVVVGYNFRMGPVAMRAFMAHKKAKSQVTLGEFGRAIKLDVQITPQVAFENFGTLKAEPVVEGLHQFLVFVSGLIEAFEPEFLDSETAS